MKSCSHALCVAAFFAWATLCGAAPAAPRHISATYNATMNGMPVGVIAEQFAGERGAYRITSETKPIGLAALIQRQSLRFVSRGEITGQGLRPLHFEGRRSAAEPPQVTADFDWREAQLVLKHNDKVESMRLAPGTQDRLSIMYQFMFMPVANARHVDFAMTNGRKLDSYRYRITPEVEIDTPLGRISTLHLVKQREADDTVTEVWLSTAHRHFPVKMLIVEKNGMRFEQLIQALDLRD